MAEPADSVILETQSLSRSFGGLRAVRDVSLALRRGELHAVIGPNGAGKSTLVNLLSGELAPTSGRIRLAGRDITRQSVHARVHLGIARSFQRTNIFPSLSALENVRLAVQAAQRVHANPFASAAAAAVTLQAAAREVLASVGLAAQTGRVSSTLSHGEQRQLEIAMALASQPQVLLLDEPLAGMGPEEGSHMAGLLKSLVADRAVLLIEHDMDFVFQVADRMTVLVEGGILASGSPQEVRASAAVQAAYLGSHA